MKYLEDFRLTQLTSDLTEAFLNTRGSGTSGPSSSSSASSSGGRMGNGRGRGGAKSRKQQNQHQHQSSTQQHPSTPSRAKKSSSSNNTNTNSPYHPLSTSYTYNPAGYSSYDNGTRSSSSCRVIYGRVEAYTTKRAGSDKKTAYQVGENYAHEMEKLNEAVESMKRERRISGGEGSELLEEGGAARAVEEQRLKEEQVKQQSERKKTRATTNTTGRPRSRSVDGVTFASSTLGPLETLMEHSPHLAMFDNGEDDTTKRPLEGILKEPSSSNKRSRAISFDISTGPSTPSSRRYISNRTESSSSLMAGTTWGSGGGGVKGGGAAQWGTKSPTEEDDSNTHPLIPQPSLYQSSFGEGNSKSSSSLPTIAPRRLVTDLILTLNASFPDYDFGDARPSDFCTLPVPEAMRRINDKLSEFAATTDRGQDFLPRFWSSMDDVVLGLKDAEVYSYAPQAGDDDPLEFLTMSMAGGNEAGDGNFLPTTTATTNNSGSRFVSGDALNCLDTSTVLSLPDRIPTSKADDSAHVTLWSMNYFFVSGNKKRIVLFACVECIGNQGDGSGDDDVVDDYEYGENDVVFDEARRGKRQEENEGEYNYPLRSVIGSPSPLESFSVAGDESVSVMVEDYGVDMDGGDEDQGENDFDTGALGTSVHPMTS
eukprot:CAMPEP_0113389084 /NCGR_PEP_ID=MMETSP0013_2-20120614/9431_1 /TAXON_ID=2843 ORGANISM="Skeletonema costatum, Strain 1716" /NCGR_SAMPLE_ID=MMETSP0013_2 /ASSEMBLY_ACC=CAM_ASM_000158 /LENGTH=651 /DNA_ID=CAMNT_0000272123 /DNA_START=286 /DNA_END=2241 /DNA_ORIENTATION=+ /assembly_acc=CAM_ASM_000158